LIDKRRNGGITPEESAYLLNNDIQRKTAEVFKALPWVKDLDQIMLNVLINMAFQLGVEGLLAFKTTLSLVQGGNYDKAAENMILSKWHSQTPERCERLAKQMRTGVWQ
jgi:lysozyme